MYTIEYSKLESYFVYMYVYCRIILRSVDTSVYWFSMSRFQLAWLPWNHGVKFMCEAMSPLATESADVWVPQVLIK